MTLRYFDLDAFRAVPLTKEPFNHLLVHDFIKQDVRDRITADYPQISERGSYPVEEHAGGASFQEFLAELESDEFRHAFEDKFEIDLSGRPAMTTVRGHCSAEDGTIHTDGKNKIITVLLYLNPHWNAEGGRLRALRSPDNLDDMLAEIPPTWTLFAFKRADNSWHGHKPYDGERRVVQLHWVKSQLYRTTQILRHQHSALAKRALGSLSLGRWRIT